MYFLDVLLTIYEIRNIAFFKAFKAGLPLNDVLYVQS